MKYDDASWHYGGSFPADLPHTAGATHIGMFFAWAMLSELAGPDITEDMPQDVLEPLRQRTQTPGEFFLALCDGKFIDDDLNEIGNAFAGHYFNMESGEYVADYEHTLASDFDTLYRVPDTWENYDVLAPVIDRRFNQWRAATNL